MPWGIMTHRCSYTLDMAALTVSERNREARSTQSRHRAFTSATNLSREGHPAPARHDDARQACPMRAVEKPVRAGRTRAAAQSGRLVVTNPHVARGGTRWDAGWGVRWGAVGCRVGRPVGRAAGRCGAPGGAMWDVRWEAWWEPVGRRDPTRGREGALGGTPP